MGMTRDGDGEPVPVDNPAGAVEAMVRWIERKGLQVPAAFVLDLHRPLLPLAWPAAMLFGGLIAPFFGPDYYEKIEALRDPAVLDRLLKRLEDSRKADDQCNTPTR
jgi:hypothetical protein